MAKNNTAQKIDEKLQFYLNCRTSGVLPRPAFCESSEISIKKTLSPTKTFAERPIA